MLVLCYKYDMFVVGWDNPLRSLRRGLGQPLAQLVVGWDNPLRKLRRGLGQPLTQIIVGWDNPSQKHLSSRAGITPHAPNGLGFTPHRIPRVFKLIPRVYKLLVLFYLIVVSDTTKPRPQRPSQSRQGIG